MILIVFVEMHIIKLQVHQSQKHCEFPKKAKRPSCDTHADN